MADFEKQLKKRAKAEHKRDQRTDPSWFKAKRVDLAKEILKHTDVRFGAFRFKYQQKAV